MATRWAAGDNPVPELRGSVAALPDGGAIVHATCGYGWNQGGIAVGLLAAGFLVWMSGGSWGPWLAGVAGLLLLADRVEAARHAYRPDRYMLYLMQRLDAALSGAESDGPPSTETNTGEGADGCVGSGSL